jgi:hypothetical protein
MKHFNMKRFIVLSFIFVFGNLAGTLQAGISIDTFDAPSAPWYNCPNINNVNLLPGTDREFDRNIGTIGGEGDFYFYADSLNSSGKYGISTFIHFRQLCARLNQLVFAGNTEFDNAETTGLSDGGFVRIVYDGSDNDIHTNAFGLGNVDLTEGGTNNILRLDISTSHLENTVDLRVYTDADNYSEAVAVTVPNTVNAYRIFDIKFSEFVSAGSIGAADFSDVTAIELQLNHPRTSGGTPMTVAGIPVGYGVGLDSFTVNKQLVANISSGFSETESGDDVNGDGDFDSTSTDADIVTYTVEITNTNDWHDQIANGVIYSASFSGSNASFINGSVETSQGSIVNETGDVEVDIGDIADGETVTITYKMQIATSVLAANQQYSHSGSVQTSDSLQFDTPEDVFIINKFDILATLSVEAKDDADGDELSGPGELVTFTATVSNDGPNTTDSVVFDFEAIPNASLETGSVNSNRGSVISGNVGTDTDVLVSINNFASLDVATITFDLLIDDPFFFAEFSSIGGQAIITNSGQFFFGLSDDPNVGGTQDPTIIAVDAFPNRIDAYQDADGDGLPENCSPAACVDEDVNPNDTDNDGTVNDPENDAADDDGDGVPNGDDDFPFHYEASTDTDDDGMPDTCINDCNVSGLSEDPDDDNDGIDDINDDFNPDVYSLEDAVSASLDSDGDGQPNHLNDGSDDGFGASVNCDSACVLASGLAVDSDDDGDGVDDINDAFTPNEYSYVTSIAAAVDADGDGLPDAWNVTCNSVCQTNSGLILDASLNDFDNDGVTGLEHQLDAEDAYPNNPIAAVDTDGDGMPDAWIEGSCDEELPVEDENSCESLSGLTLDDDDDNDDVLDVDDDLPLDRAASVDGDSDGDPDSWNDGSNGSIVCDLTCQNDSGLTLDLFLDDSNNDGTPNNADDDDGDGIPNGTDTEPTRDNNPPVVTAPTDKTIDARGELTSVSLGLASAEDFLDGTLDAKADNKGPFAVGVHIVTWSAVDAAGNVGTATQTITVIGQAESEGSSEEESSTSGGGGGGSLGFITLLALLGFSLKSRKLSV